jgi:hypothetical protein
LEVGQLSAGHHAGQPLDRLAGGLGDKFEVLIQMQNGEAREFGRRRAVRRRS